MVRPDPIMLSGALLFAIAVMPGAIAPGFLGEAANAFELAESRLGLMLGVWYGIWGLVSATAYFWVREVNWRLFCLIGVSIMGVSFILMGFADTYRNLMLLMALNGAAAGMVASPTMTILGDGAKPENGFSTMIIFSVLGAAGLLVLMPIASDMAGFKGTMYLLGGTTLATGLVVPLIPSENSTKELFEAKSASEFANSNVMSNNFILPALSLLTMVLFCFAFLGSWAFFERIGHYSELNAQVIGQMLAFGTMFGAIGAPLMAFLIKIISMHYLYLLTIFCTVASISLFSVLPLTPATYLALVCLFQFSINGGFCLIMAQTAEVDKIGRFVALIPAAEAAGGLLGPPITGWTIEHFGMNQMILLTAIVFILGALLFSYVDRKNLNRPCNQT